MQVKNPQSKSVEKKKGTAAEDKIREKTKR